MLPKMDAQDESETKHFGNIDSFLIELKAMVSKSSSSSLFTLEFLTQKFRLLESTIHSEVAPLSKLLNLPPTDAPHVVIGVQRGERKIVGVSKGEGASGKASGDVKVVGKVLTTQIPTTLPKKTDPIISTTSTTKPLEKGIIIGGSSSSSKPTPTEADKAKGKSVVIEQSKEERKCDIPKFLNQKRPI